MRRHTELEAWLPTAVQVAIAELLTVTNSAGGAWRYATSVDDVTDGEETWLGSASDGGLLWRRSKLNFKAGIELGECTLIISARPPATPDGAADAISGVPVAAALRARVWDDAQFLLSRAYFDADGALRGVLPRYQGQMGKKKLLDGDVELTLKPPSVTFNRAVPPVYQAACHNTVYDAACGVNRAAFTVTGRVQPGSTAASVRTGRGEATDYFAGGMIAFTSGALDGLARTVRSHAGDGSVSFFQAFPAAPDTGDAFELTPGCDRSMGAGGCARFYSSANVVKRFRGTPFIPQPEAAV